MYKSAHALWPVYLMGADRKQGNTKRVNIDRDFCCGLDCIGMKRYILSFAILPIFLYRLGRFDSLLACMIVINIVRGVIAFSTSAGSTIPSLLTGRYVSPEAIFFKVFAGVQDCMVFNRACYYMIALFPVLDCDPFYCEVIDSVPLP